MIKRKPSASSESGRNSIDIALPASAARSDGMARPSTSMESVAVNNYLIDMIAQLESLARATNKDMLAYLLSMASVQAAAPETRWDRSNALH